MDTNLPFYGLDCLCSTLDLFINKGITTSMFNPNLRVVLVFVSEQEMTYMYVRLSEAKVKKQY